MGRFYLLLCDRLKNKTPVLGTGVLATKERVVVQQRVKTRFLLK